MRLSIVLFTLLLQPEAAAACKAGDLACNSGANPRAVASSFENSNGCTACEAALAVDGLPGTRWGSTLFGAIHSGFMLTSALL
jgi:hypothetical protein